MILQLEMARKQPYIFIKLVIWPIVDKSWANSSCSKVVAGFKEEKAKQFTVTFDTAFRSLPEEADDCKGVNSLSPACTWPYNLWPKELLRAALVETG